MSKNITSLGNETLTDESVASNKRYDAEIHARLRTNKSIKIKGFLNGYNALCSMLRVNGFLLKLPSVNFPNLLYCIGLFWTFVVTNSGDPGET